MHEQAVRPAVRCPAAFVVESLELFLSFRPTGRICISLRFVHE